MLDVFGLRVNNLGQVLMFDSDGNLSAYISPLSFENDYYHSQMFPDSPVDLCH